MDLAGQIAQITDPLEFVKLCNAVFLAEHPDDYQIVDGTRADGGNDGYIRSEKRMLAFYCTEKPEKDTDKKFTRKIEDDLRKAHNLHVRGTWIVEAWTVVTPRPLSNAVLEGMNKCGSELGIEVHSLDATYLAMALLRNRYLLQMFPSLYVWEIEQILKEVIEIRSSVTRESTQDADTSKQPSADWSLQSPPHKSLDFEKVMEIIQNEQTGSSKSELKTIFYKSTDPYVCGTVILGLIQWYDPLEDTFDDLAAWCDRGIAIALRIGDRAHEAYFRAQKGLYLSGKYVMLDQSTALAIRSDNLIGIQTVSEPQRQAVLRELDRLETAFTADFREALRLATETNDLQAYAYVTVALGNAAGHRARHFLSMGLSDRASREKETSLNALLTAKEAFARCGDELRVAYAMHNLANHLRMLGEPSEALELVKLSESIAEKHDDFRLKQMSAGLRSTIESGRIPDYARGERRERKR